MDFYDILIAKQLDGGGGGGGSSMQDVTSQVTFTEGTNDSLVAYTDGTYFMAYGRVNSVDTGRGNKVTIILPFAINGYSAIGTTVGTMTNSATLNQSSATLGSNPIIMAVGTKA